MCQESSIMRHVNQNHLVVAILNQLLAPGVDMRMYFNGVKVF